MRTRIYFSIIVLLFVTAACYEDQGSYDYTTVEIPVVKDLVDSTFDAIVGDTLEITPTVVHSLANTDQLSYKWQFMFPYEPFFQYFEGRTLKTLFSLVPGTYDATLTITDNSNNLKYYYDFKISAKTEFSVGTVVLTDVGGAAQLAFVKPDGTIMPNLYEGLNGEPLPSQPKQLLARNLAFQPTNIIDYWVVSGDPQNAGVIIDASTMKKASLIRDNFFDPPASFSVNNLQAGNFYGVTTGVIDHKLYRGTSNTFYGFPTYGKYGLPAAGDYALADDYILAGADTPGPQYYITFDTKKKRMVTFDMATVYKDTTYDVIPTGPGFDPKNIGIDMFAMEHLNNSVALAFARDGGGKIYEYNFSHDPVTIRPKYRREFKGASLVRENTNFIGTIYEDLYFNSDDKIYKFSHVNQDLVALDADFGGKIVTMLKLDKINGKDVLLAGTEGALYYLDIDTGKNGNITYTLDGLDGDVIDVAIRK
ncbi:PKD-like family lipoprotein [Parachryseolinea silvisoli]|jgi:hypothetical protein|uniref:PKD-like family lipoprotein n=1 Tax=Parachryseolinea silvisoli TaxID=2873601 RepID=UPI002265A76F|nr:PKD-like family lipoprotein [Parachryseolinea silvisoli]MCD9020027.1 hypothetical protein [Parachryseolinea silvisoli]